MSKENSVYKKIFDEYDKNNNQVIEKNEFESFFRHVLLSLGEQMTEEELQLTIQEGINIFDSNNNHTLEFNEFVRIMDFLVHEKGYKLK